MFFIKLCRWPSQHVKKRLVTLASVKRLLVYFNWRKTDRIAFLRGDHWVTKQTVGLVGTMQKS
jgi:hypothetical protein